MTRIGWNRGAELWEKAKCAKVPESWLNCFDDLELYAITPKPGIEAYIRPGDGWRLIGQICEARELGLDPTPIISHTLDADEARRYIATRLVGADEVKAIECAKDESKNPRLEMFIRVMLGQSKTEYKKATGVRGKLLEVFDLLNESNPEGGPLPAETGKRAEELKRIYRKVYGKNYERKLIK